MKPTRKVLEHGQSIWFDYIERKMLWDGSLHRMIEEEGLRGITSNPSIFEKAMGGSEAYLPAMRQAVSRGASADEAFELLAVEDIQWTCDVFLPVYRETGVDGMVSLEVSPHLAYDAFETIEEAHRLWEAVGRDNLMIKVPGTEPGLLAVEQLLSDGLNVNITLLFSVERYKQVMDAFLRALERRKEAGLAIDHIGSVASFFVSRIDSKIDKRLQGGVEEGRWTAGQAAELAGRVAIANAQRAYGHYLTVIESQRWKALEAAGARPQRLLWASTSAKNPDYKDTLYVESLVGRDTVNTVPAATYQAFNDHGQVASALPGDGEPVLSKLDALGISLDQVTAELEAEGVTLFSGAFDRLMGSVEARRQELLAPALPRFSYLGLDLSDAMGARLRRYQEANVSRRLWSRDGSLFSEDESVQAKAEAFMGWLDVADSMVDEGESFDALTDTLSEADVDVAVLMGMGGSSLAPEVFRRTFPVSDEGPALQVLDSTHPAAVQAVLQQVGSKEAVFFVASKSGTTAEVKAFDDLFFDRVASEEPDGEAGHRFFAITDPDSPLERSSFERGFQGVYHGEPDVGGRFSALSPFGLVPAAAGGHDVVELLERAQLLIGSCRPAVPAEQNPGLRLAAHLAELWERGRDKWTLVTSPGVAAFGVWLEQLVAESLGKGGQGVVPVDGEAVASPDSYGSDRVFLHIALSGESESAEVDALAAAGHPVFRTVLNESYDVVQEMFRWMYAVAVLGHERGLDPFDQPDVQASKDITKRLLARLEANESIDAPEDGQRLTGPHGATGWTDAAGRDRLLGVHDVVDAVVRLVDQAEVPGFVALLAFTPTDADHESAFRELQAAIRDRRKVATTFGFGPRYLHSTGQLHKGGPDNGTFLQFFSAGSEDVSIPGRNYGFRAFCEAQSWGDLLALSERGRTLLRVDLGTQDPMAVLQACTQGLRGG